MNLRPNVIDPKAGHSNARESLLSRVHPISFRFPHHSSPSGYDTLARFLGTSIESGPLPKWLIPNRIIWRLAGGIVLYDRHALALELNAALQALRHSRHIYHFIYGENSYKYLSLVSRLRGNKVVASFHQPPAILDKWLTESWPIRLLSAIIVLGRNQLSFFKSLVDQSKIHFVPHGIDTEFFSPSSVKDDNRPVSCLIVGNWLRDFECLRDVIVHVLRHRSDINFTVVTLRENHKYLQDLPIQLLSNIPEENLLILYRTSTILLLPLTDFVASNTLLEGMACGLPVIASDVGAIRDYANEDCAYFTPPRDAFAMSDALMDFINNPNSQKLMSKASRKRALEFTWPKIIEQLIEIYELIDDDKR